MGRRAKVVWAAPALDDLDEIVAFIALDDRRAAAALARKTINAVDRLRQNPDSGRWVPEVIGKIYREIIVGPCRVIYRREGAGVLIVHVVRSERMLRGHRLI